MNNGQLIVETAAAEVFRAPLITPFRIATGQHDELQNVLLHLQLADGVEGWGEAAVATHITGETVPRTLANLRKAAASVAGVDLADYRGVCAEFRPLFERNHAGLAAFEMAVLDAVSRSGRIPLWRLFGAKPVRLATDITIVIGSLAEAAESARDFVRRGFRSFKIKIGGDEALDLARVLAVARIAPRSSILLDANQGSDALRMMRFVKRLRKHGIYPALLEQPVPRGDWDGLARLTRESGVPVCADESVRSLGEAVRAVKLGVVNAVNVKFMKSGILEGAEIARFARAHGLKLMIGAMMETALAITAAAHFAAGLACFGFIDLDTTFFVKGPWSRSPYLDNRGRFDVAEAGPGIGLVPSHWQEPHQRTK